MEKLISGLLGRPRMALVLAIGIPTLAFVVQVSLLFDSYRSHGSGAYLHSPTALEIAGRQVYLNQGCQYCHTQALREIEVELLRYAPSETYGYFPNMSAAESEYDAPSVRGSRRLGPDLSRLAGRLNSRELQRLLEGKSGTALAQGLHSFGGLFAELKAYEPADALFLSWRMRAMMQAGVPLSDPLQQSALSDIVGNTPGQALTAYLLTLGERQRAFAANYFKK